MVETPKPAGATTNKGRRATQRGPAPVRSNDVKATRHSRSRQATRQKLIEAALTVVARKGLENTAINDITEEADVGFGSFYNHFSSKSEIATIVFEMRAQELATIGDMIAEHEQDPAIAVAYIQRLFLTKAVADPVWGWFVVHATNSLPEMARVFMVHGKRDIERGIAESRFSVASVETAMRVILSALLGTMRAILEKEAPATAVNETIECLLRMLGVEGREARTLSQKKLPQYITRQFAD
jgi:AcrR family transcriptional regulator